jgi:hypothetical protein
MTYDKATDEALDVVAVSYACRLLRNRADEDDWEDYAELGQDDFLEVVERVKKLGVFPMDAEFAAAYAHLAKRANGVEA